VTVQDEKGANELGETAVQILTLLDQQIGRWSKVKLAKVKNSRR
jgi:hypothetical protein